jgi:NAD(P)-dependent dehydrogenase (short-subunit alcohol dehydrogenase family)
MPELEGRVAIVTGASAGVGRAYALALAGAGAVVVAVARSIGRVGDGDAPRNTLAEVVQASTGLSGRVFAHACDVELESDVMRMVDLTMANFRRIDVLVNNAAIYPHHPTFGITCDEWDTSMRVNVRGPYLTIKHVAPHMINRGSGSIINLTSASAAPTEKGHPGHEDLLTYAVSKAALNRLSTFMAEELRAHGIAVNAMSPGAVLTDTWAAVDPDAVAAAKESGWGKEPTAEVMGPALLDLAQQTAETRTGQILHNDQFGTSWP